MKKYTKLIIFFLAAAVNVVFFLLCGYGKVQMPNTSNLLDPLLGIIAVAALAFGEMRLITQLYFRGKYREMRIRTFDFKFLRQCFAIVAYYVGTLAYLAMATTIYKAGYISVFAIALCPLWMIGGAAFLAVEAMGGMSTMFTLVTIAAMVLLPTAYSYLYYRRHRGEEE